MNNKRKDEAEEQKRQLFLQQKGLCAACGLPLDRYNYNIAHVIPKTKVWLRKYGEKIIHHRLNLRATHSGACNDHVMKSPATNTIFCDELIKKIKKEIDI